MKVTVRLNGFANGAATFTRAGAHFDQAVTTALEEFGQDYIKELRRMVNAGGVTPKKARPNGRPTLIDSGNYLASYTAEVAGKSLRVGPTGDNDHMSNADLAELLEYGAAPQIPARPHIRIVNAWAERLAPRKIAGKVMRELFRNS